LTVWRNVLARDALQQGRAEPVEGPGLVGSATPAALDASGDRLPNAAPRLSGTLLVGAALLAALVVDWFLATRSYPVAAAYGVSLLIAAQSLSPRAVAVTGCLALLLSVLSNNLQNAPTAAWLADNTGLIGLGVLAVLLARQREVTHSARQRSEAIQRRVELAYDAARALAEARTLDAAGSSLLASIGHHLAWACGALWRVDEAGDALACIATWQRLDEHSSALGHLLGQSRIDRGVGLPGRVWASGQPLWLADLQSEANFPRRSTAVDLGLRTGFAFPIRHAGETLGVIEFFDTCPRQPDHELLKLMDTLGAQVGPFLGRRQAEGQVAALLERERAARLDADEAVRVRDAFLASASHDLRGPLTAIYGYAALAQRRIQTGDLERVPAALNSIQASVKRLTATLDELLDLAKLEAGQRLALRRAATDLVALVRRVAAEQEIAEERCSVQVQTDQAELLGWWDAGRLERALTNLVGNAVKYSPPGRAEVRVAVTREQDSRGGWAVVEVQDQGVGIPAADLPHIFERFHRATNVGDRLPGTGLGLAGAREVVEQHGGELRVQSQEGYGSTFTVRLPLTPSGQGEPGLTG
jgi:signal transduction histidine kinase